MQSFGIEKIMELLPHRYPFLLVDRVLETEGGQHLVAIKNTTMNELYFQGHFPGYPVMPGVLQIEAIAQAAGLMMLSHLGEEAEKVADYDTILLSVSQAKFRKIVKPGDQLRIETTLISQRRMIANVQGVITVDGAVATEASLMFMLVPKASRAGTSEK